MPEVFVKMKSDDTTKSGDTTLSLKFERTDTLQTLTEKIMAQLPDPCPRGHRLLLLYSGHPMEDDRTLADYNVANASVLHAVKKPLPKASAEEGEAISGAPPRQFEQAVDTGSCYVYCAGGRHGEGGRRHVCRCSFRLRCTSCGSEGIVLPEGKTMQDLCPTVACLRRCMSSKARIPGTVCHNYDAGEHDGGPGLAGVDCGSIFVACDEPQLDGHACQAASYLSQCSLLTQVVKAGPGEKCAVSFEEPDDGKLIRFDPCGHKISLEYFIEHAKQEISSGLASTRLIRSQLTGHVAFACPMGGELCAGSLVHDLHHYAMLGADAHGVSYYNRIKELAVEQYRPAPATQATRPGSPQASLLAQIREAIDRAQIFQCPREACGAQGVKDGGCMFPLCPGCRKEFCYWCGQPSEGHECQSGCGPIFLTEAKLSNGFEFSENGHAALQEYHVWRLKWRLKVLCDRVGRRRFEAAVAGEPGVLEELFADDGTGDLGVHGALPGVTVRVDEIIDYSHVTVVGKFSPEDRCDPFPLGSSPRGCAMS